MTAVHLVRDGVRGLRAAGRGVRLCSAAWTAVTRSGNSSPLAARDCLHRRPVYPCAATNGAFPACVAMRSPGSPRSASITTYGSSAATFAAPPTACSMHSPAPCSSTTPNAFTSTTSPAAEPAKTARTSKRSAQAFSNCSTPSPRRRSCAIHVWTISPPTVSEARCCARCSKQPAAAPNQARYVFLDPRAKRFHPDWQNVANDFAAMLRLESGRSPTDQQLTQLVDELLEASPEFRSRWESANVRLSQAGAGKRSPSDRRRAAPHRRIDGRPHQRPPDLLGRDRDASFPVRRRPITPQGMVLERPDTLAMKALPKRA